MVRLSEYSGDRSALRPLFELADDSGLQLDEYIDAGAVLVAVDQETVVGHLQLTTTGQPDEREIRNMAVLPTHQRRGIGSLLIGEAIRRALAARCRRLVVATAAGDTGNLRFYQRSGFRMLAIERDAFGPDQGYAPGTLSEGIELRDRVWLDLTLEESA